MTSSGGEPPSEDPRYGIVFSGGGALAAWQVGCADVIQGAHPTPPVALVGTSAGGLNAAAFRTGMTPWEVGRIWEQIGRRDVYRWCVVDILRSAVTGVTQAGRRRSVRQGVVVAGSALPSVLTTSPLAHTLRRHLSDRMDDFFTSEVAFGVTAANIDEQRRVYFYDWSKPSPLRAGSAECRRVASEDDLVHALIATTALPVVFPHVGGLYDGGVFRNSPVGLAALLGAERIYVLVPSPASRPAARGVVETAGRLIDAWVAQPLEWDIQRIKDRNLATRRDKTRRPTTVITIRPSEDLRTVHRTGTLGFGRCVHELIEGGRQDAAKSLRMSDHVPA